MNRVGVFLMSLRVGHRLARSFLIAVAFAAIGSVAVADSPAVTESVFADCRLTIFARQALQQDILLSAHNVGVSVNGRIAKLWGAVPSADLSARAEKVVRDVPGIGSVKNELRMEKPGLPDNGLHVKSLSPPKPTSNATKLTHSGPSAAAATPVPAVAVTLKAPVALIIPAHSEKPQHSDLQNHIRQLVQRDKRFHDVGVDVNYGVVFLRGGVRRWADLFELANMVSKVPGVQRVVLNELRLNRLEPLYMP